VFRHNWTGDFDFSSAGFLHTFEGRCGFSFLGSQALFFENKYFDTLMMYILIK
jgi:hypothetical protein